MQQMQYTGTVKWFNFEKGWGFIQSEQTDGKEVFLNKAVNEQMAAAGDTVTFTIEQGQKGIQATTCQVVVRGQGQFKGTVRNYNEQKGFGFIDCEPTKAIYQKDVFFAKAELGKEICVSDGMLVRFGVNVTEKGPQACNIKVLEQGGGSSSSGGGMDPKLMQQMMTMMQQAASSGGNAQVMQKMMSSLMSTFTSSNQQNSGKGKGKGGPPGQGYQGGGMNSGFQGGQGGGSGSGGPQSNWPTIGTVKTFNVDKGWGFIEQANGQDVFVMRSNIDGGVLNVGDQVQFKVAMGQKGMQATEVKHLGPELAGTHTGTVKTFMAQKGWGFIECVATASYGDIFLHSKDLNNQVVNTGDQVQYTIAINQNGRPQAQNIVVMGGGSAMPADMAQQMGFGAMRPQQFGDQRAAPY